MQKPEVLWKQLLVKWGYFPAEKEAESVEIQDPSANEAPSRFVKEEQQKEYVEKHIVEEPEQVIKTTNDYVELASVSNDDFVEVIAETEKSEPTPQPEADAELTKTEEAVVKKTTKKKTKKN